MPEAVFENFSSLMNEADVLNGPEEVRVIVNNEGKNAEQFTNLPATLLFFLFFFFQSASLKVLIHQH